MNGAINGQGLATHTTLTHPKVNTKIGAKEEFNKKISFAQNI